MPQRSINFGFLKQYEKLETVAANAERDWHRNPVGALIQTRLFAELLVAQVSIKLRFHTSTLHNFTDVIERIEAAGIPRDPIDLLHELRRRGNDAAHRASGTSREALDCLERAHRVAIWFQRTFHDSQYKSVAFIQPTDAGPSIQALEQRLAALQAEAAKHQGDAQAAKAEAAAAKARAEQEAFEREVAQELAARASEEKKIWEELAAESDKAAKDAARQATSRTAKAKDPEEIIREFVTKAKAAARAIHRSEADVRQDIDEQLRRVGWEADTEKLAELLPLDLPIEMKCAARVADRAIVELDVDVPEASAIPPNEAKLTAAGKVSYKNKPAARVRGEYSRLICGVGMRLASEVMLNLPTCNVVRLRAWRTRIDPARGNLQRVLALDVDYDYATLAPLSMPEIDPVAALTHFRHKFTPDA